MLIVVKGQKGATAGTDTRVAVDAFQVGATLHPTPVLKYGWRTVAASGASGGHYAQADLPGSSVSFPFRGPAVSWHTVAGPNQGTASVYVDGALKGTFDNYAAATTYNVTHAITGLSDATHTLRIVVLGQEQPASAGTQVAVDRWTVT